jgi:hypothetical protein
LAKRSENLMMRTASTAMPRFVGPAKDKSTRRRIVIVIVIVIAGCPQRPSAMKV